MKTRKGIWSNFEKTKLSAARLAGDLPVNILEDISMELSAEQDAKFRGLCKEIKLGEYGRVVVSFVGNPSNLVTLSAEKTFRFYNQKAEPSHGEAQDRQKSGRMG
jgi:hypothetical protein